MSTMIHVLSIMVLILLTHLEFEERILGMHDNYLIGYLVVLLVL